MRAAPIPPANLDAEQAVLGALLLEGARAMERVAGRLEPEDFLLGRHRTLYGRMRALHEDERPITTLLLTDALREAGELEEVGGPAALALLVEQASLEVHLTSYVDLVLRDSGRRRQHQVLVQFAERAMLNGAKPEAIAAEAMDALGKIAERTAPEAFRESGQRTPPFAPIGEVLERTVLDLHFDMPDLVPTGIPALNEAFGGGYARGELVLLGGGPGVAKSALMLEGARHAADPAAGGHPVGIVSVEMTATALGRRTLAQNAQVGALALRAGKLAPDEWERIDRIVPVLSRLPIWLSDEVTHVRQIGRMLKRKRPALRLLFVDYLQLLEGPPSAARYLEVAAIAKTLKRLATRHDMTIVALSSITPPPQDRVRRKKPVRPTMRNLRDSRDLDHAADIILMLWQPDPESSDRELVIEKGRDGAAGGAIRLAFTPAYVRFQEFA